MTTFIYIHGYGSSSLSEKARELRSFYPGLITPDVPTDYNEAKNVLEDLVNSIPDMYDICLIGTSLGGYWATHLSNVFRVPAVVINPSCRPAKTLGHRDPDLLTYPDLVVSPDVQRILLLAKDDDVLDYRIAEELFRGKALRIVFENGGHRFSDINKIIAAMKEMDTACMLPIP